MPKEDLWLNTLISPSGQSSVTVPFGQSFTIGADNQRDVKPVRFGPVQSAIDGKLTVGTVNKITPANDLVNPLIVVVDHDCQLIGDWSIVSRDDEISEQFSCVETLRAIKIVHPFADLIGHPKSPSELNTGGFQTIASPTERDAHEPG